MVDDEGMIGMVSIGDVVRAVVNEHREELDRLNACTYIYKGVTRKSSSRRVKYYSMKMAKTPKVWFDLTMCCSLSLRS